jgi:hypothetical protein
MTCPGATLLFKFSFTLTSSWEANRRWSSQGFGTSYWTWKFIFPFTRSRHWLLSQMNPRLLLIPLRSILILHSYITSCLQGHHFFMFSY